MSASVFVIDDEEPLRNACAQAFELADLPVETFPGAEGITERVNRDWRGIIVTDIKMPGVSGLELMDAVLAIDPDIPVVLITGHGDVAMAVDAMRHGAYDFIEKPFAPDVLVETARRGLEKRRLVLENRSLRSALDGGQSLDRVLIGRSQSAVRLRAQIMDFAQTDADVLIHGETGAGKELIARSLHENSPRKHERFVAINCGALPDTLIESELFGHKAGAFTGASKARTGRIAYASGGTLFLDEIESMPLDLQVKMLRVLQDRTIVPLGGNEEIPVDVRIVAATKEDLRVASDEGRFREDLYYRLDVLALTVPPLRERTEDIALLFQHFLNQASQRYKRPDRTVSPELAADLAARDWPGNVRELQNAATRYALDAWPVDEDDNGEDPTLAGQMDVVEKRLIELAVRKHDGQLRPTYEALGISRKTLYDKMRKYGITAADPGIE